MQPNTDTTELPPHDLVAELGALGASILSPQALATVRGIIEPEAFLQVDHQIIFRVLCEMADGGKPIDTVTIRGELLQRGLLEDVGGVPYLAQILSSVPDAKHAAEYAQTVARRHRERLAIAHCEALAKRLQNPRRDESTDAAIAQAGEKLAALAKPRESGGPILRCLSGIEPLPVKWAWKHRIPAGCITMVVGRPKEGKSVLTIDAAARVSTGTPWPDGAECERGSVIIISAEDDPARVIRPRLDAHRADLRRIHLLSAVRRIVDGKAQEATFTLADVRALEDALARVPDCRLCIVDPIGSFLGGGVEMNAENDVRGVLAPVAKLAEQYGPAVLMVAHRRKGGSDGRYADDLALGSRAFSGIARAIWHLSRDADDKARRLLLPGGCNYVGDVPGLAFTIAGDPPAIVWERDPVPLTADEALTQEREGDGRGRPPDERDAAVAWLEGELAGGVARLVEDVKRAALEAGLVWRTCQRAASELRVVRHREGFGGGFTWRLPPAPIRATSGATGDYGTNGTNGDSWRERGLADGPQRHTCQANSLGTNGGNGQPTTEDYEVAEALDLASKRGRR